MQLGGGGVLVRFWDSFCDDHFSCTGVLWSVESLLGAT